MKKLLVLVASATLLFGCLETTQQLRQHEITIRVEAVEPAELRVTSEPTIRMAMDVPYEEGELSQMTFVSNGEAFIKIFAGLSVGDVTNLWNDLCILEKKTQIRKINLFINSPGGDAFSGLALADQIERAKKKGFHIAAHASGIIASAALPVFASCTKRFAAPGTIFMIHEPSLWKWPGRESSSDIRAQTKLFDLLQEKYRAKLAAGSNLAPDEWASLEKETTWFSAEQAKKWGLVDEIE